MEEIIEYLSTAPCMALVGCGPSCELGLPTWRGLADLILQRVNALGLPDEDVDPIEFAFAADDFPLMFERIVKCTKLGSKYLYENCKDVLKAKDGEGKIYRALVSLPLQAYFTTNFDDLIARHIEAAGVVPQTSSNTKHDLERVDVDALRYVVKLHGDLEHLETLVLTQNQYDRVAFAPEFEYLRYFIKSYLQTRRFLIIGYSVRDPDIQALLKQSTFLLRRAVPIYAIVANADKTAIDEWYRSYNIRVLPYQSPKGDHSELVPILETLRDYVKPLALPPRARLEVDLRVAQSLYMWHKFQIQSEPTVSMDAFKSLLLSIAVRHRRTNGDVELGTLSKEMRDLTGMPDVEVDSRVPLALESLCKEGLLVRGASGESLQVPRKTAELVGKFGDQYTNLIENFKSQVKLDFKAGQGASALTDAQLRDIAEKALETISAIFSQRGVEIVNMVFSGQQPRTVGAVTLFRIINTAAGQLTKSGIRYQFVRYMTQMFSAPKPAQERLLEYLSKAFVCVQALAMDPDGARFRREFLANRTLLVDSNVLIPTLAEGGSKYQFFHGLLGAAVTAGTELITTTRVMDEVYDHLTFAQRVVQENGEGSIEVLRAAMGEGPYRKNAFLDGWIRYVTENGKLRFLKYLEMVFGNLSERSFIQRKLMKAYGLKTLDFGELSTVGTNAYVVRDETEEYIAQSAEQRGIDKSEGRVKAEGEAYSFIYFWPSIGTEGEPRPDRRCRLLSQGGFLNRIAYDGPHPLGAPVVVNPDVLYEFAVRMGKAPVRFASFSEVLHSSYLYSADYFVDTKKYAEFFGEIINEAERVYSQGLESYRRYIDGTLTATSIAEVEPLNRPLVVDRLQSSLKSNLAEMEARYAQLAEEKTKLEKTLEEEREQNRQARKKVQKMGDYGKRVARRSAKRKHKRRR